MKKIFSFLVALVAVTSISAQSVGYYNGAEGLKGAALKSALHNIIDDHKDYGYDNAKYILNYADEDPENPDNFIQLYTNRSVSKLSWGTGGDKSNKEHVWAASHGDFRELNPMTGDAHNLHAADASTNITRSNFDFDELTGGGYIEEADAYYDASSMTFEPADRDKGVIARTILYMTVRYEGDNGELDLEAVDRVATSSTSVAEHGRLSTLLKWHKQYPPTDFERRRNQRVFEYQGNRNPFVDHPEYVDLIWADAELSGLTISDVSCSPSLPSRGEEVTINAMLSGATSAKLLWGESYSTATNEVLNTSNNKSGFMAKFTPVPNASGIVHLKVIMANSEASDTLYATLKYIKDGLDIIPITSVQGTGDETPLKDETVTVAGVVTASLGSQFYIQSSNEMRSGVLIYGETLNGNIGDSVVVTGVPTEYNGLTEIKSVSYVYNFGPVTPITPIMLDIADVNEDYEGMLVQFKGVNFVESGTFASSKSYSIAQGENTISMYLSYASYLTYEKIPEGTIDVIALISQYNAYQIVIQDISWIEGDGSAALSSVGELNLNIYPQPISNGVLNLVSEERIQKLSIYTLAGEMVLHLDKINNMSCHLDLEGFKAGVYMIKINSKDKVVTRKIIVR